MTDNELLLSISDMMDRKLKPIEDRMGSMEGRMESMEGRMESMEGRMESMEGRMESMEGRMGSMEGQIVSMEGQIVSMEGQIVSIKDRQTRMEILIENEVLPRLQTIESCYTSTYERYAAAADKCEKVVEDVELMKKVIAEHSDKLNRIA